MTHKRIAVFPAEMTATKSADTGEMLVEGIITTEGIDRTSERMRMTGLRNLDEYLANPIVRWQHGEPIGHAKTVTPQKTKIKVVDTLAPTATVLNTVWPLVEHGSIKAFSIGFYGHGGQQVGETWEWTDWSLLEHSLVDIPANPQAAAQVIKSLAQAHGYDYGPLETKGVTRVDKPIAEDEARAWNGPEAEKRIRAWAGAEDAPNDKYKGCFLWFDDSKPEDFGSYKFGLCDVVDGSAKVLWRGVVACMGYLDRADIPAADKEKIHGVLMGYYEKFGKEQPDKQAGKWEWKSGEKRILEVNLCGERVLRLRGAAQGVADILSHWQGAEDWEGLRREVDSAGLKAAEAHIAQVLHDLEPVSETGDRGADIESALLAAGAQLEAIAARL